MFWQSLKSSRRAFCSLGLLTITLSFITLFSSSSAFAQSEQQKVIPAALKGWQNWVLKDKDYVRCPFINKTRFAHQSNHICAWSGPLKLNITQTGGEFEQTWQVLESSNIMLPGSLDHWPVNVTLNNAAVSVEENAGMPQIRLNKGTHVIRGAFSWAGMPSQLTLSPQTPWLQLTSKGKKVDFPRVEASVLLLNSTVESNTQQEALDINVARKVTDGQHIQLDTHINLSVSGSTREVILGKVLPENFDLINIEAELPSFIDENGLLTVQVKAGEYTIDVSAYAMPDKLVWQRPEVSHKWPQSEVWVVQTNPVLRTGKIEGAAFIDAEQADMPDNWHAFPSYLVEQEDALEYIVNLRGKPMSAQNRLTLNREYWLSFDHKSLQFVDEISGKMVRDWRLSMQAPFKLESADDTQGAILITQQNSAQASGETGIENRYPALEIEARGSVDTNAMSLVTGWQHQFDSVSMTINLPPGTLFLHASDVDYAANIWVNKWGIWTSFVVLFTAIIVYRLLGIAIGLLTAFLFILIYQETAAPIMLIFNLIIAMTAKKHLGFEKIKVWVNRYWALSLGLAFVAILYFCASQIKSVVYPQLETRLNSNDVYGMFNSKPQQTRFNTPTMQVESMVSEPEIRRSREMMDEEVEAIQVTGSYVTQKDSIKQKYQSDAVLQTGAGIPQWRWKSYSLHWDTPVSAEQTFDLLLLSKNQYRSFKLLGVLILLAWFYLVCRPNIGPTIEKLKSKQKDDEASSATSSALSLALIFMLGLSLTPYNDAIAQQQNSPTYVPPSETLNELKAWLLSPPDCAPQCAQLQNVSINKVSKQQSAITLQVHVSAATGFALPRAELTQIQSIQLNKKDYDQLLRKQNWVYIWLPEGVHNIDIVSRIAPVPSWQLAFKLKPKSIQFSAHSDWTINGITNGIMQSNEIEFVSTQNTLLPNASSAMNSSELTSNNAQSRTQAADQTQAQQLQSKPLVALTRRIVFDQTWRVTTTVKRIAPSSGSINLSIPLLTGEFVLSNNVEVKAERVLLTLSASSEQFTYNSALERTDTLALYAEPNNNTVEQWQLLASPNTHLTLSAVPEALIINNEKDYYTHHFFPYPNETLKLKISRPTAVVGESLAFDTAKLSVEQGARNSGVTLELAYRSNRGGEHTIDLPANYVLQSVLSNNKRLNLQAQNGQLTFPVLPGNNELSIEMKAEKGFQVIQQQPEFNLNAPVSNLYSNLNLGNQRWVLWTTGPVIGPAVLYWGELLAFIIVALIISRLPFSPLSTVSWIILGLGLSMSNWGVLVLVTFWFATVFAASKRPTTMSVARFNLSQILLYALSLATILALLFTIPYSLLSSPNMAIDGNAVYGNGLSWFADKSAGELPSITVLSLPIIAYKGIMLVWVIWLCFAFINWAKWAWQKIGTQGYWRARQA